MTENFWVIGSFVQTVIKIQNCIANEFLIDLNLLMSDFKVSHINPKAPGLFGQLNTRGGERVESTHFGKHYLNPPNFHSRPTNSVSYES